jgi:ribosomal protein L30/L7E
MSGKMIAAIRLRGSIKVRSEVKDTLRMLKLGRKNSLSIIKVTPSNMAMIKKSEDFITWGELPEGIREIKKFRLKPAKLKSIKERYPKGDLGYRGEKIVELIEKMM